MLSSRLPIEDMHVLKIEFAYGKNSNRQIGGVDSEKRRLMAGHPSGSATIRCSCVSPPGSRSTLEMMTISKRSCDVRQKPGGNLDHVFPDEKSTKIFVARLTSFA